jgi:hypothetical protein
MPDDLEKLGIAAFPPAQLWMSQPKFLYERAQFMLLREACTICICISIPA